MTDRYPRFTLYSAVQTEVITLAEAKVAIKIDSTNFDDNITITSCITGGYSNITATATGSGILVSGKKCLAVLEPIALSASSTLDVKLQESLDNTTYTDVTDGAFTQVTTANMTTIQELEYDGAYPYLRAVYTIVSAQASFTVNMITSEPTAVDDDYIEELITAAREYIEELTVRAIGSQKWKMLMDDFPADDSIEILFPPLTEVDSVTYINSSGVSATMSASDSNGYIVDTNSEPGRIFMSYGGSWPSFTAYPHNAVEIIFTCGYTSTTIPKRTKDAILKTIGLMHRYRDGIPPDALKAISNYIYGNRLINLG